MLFCYRFSVYEILMFQPKNVKNKYRHNMGESETGKEKDNKNGTAEGM